jgi:hypothetical protein
VAVPATTAAPATRRPSTARTDAPGVVRGRDGRIAVDKAHRHDASSGVFRLTDPPPAPPQQIVSATRDWPVGDVNHGFVPDASKPLIAVVTLNSQDTKSSAGTRASWMHELSYRNKQAYCAKWGYDLIIEGHAIVDQTRDTAWSKLPVFRKWLPKYQWVMWMDMDAFFTRFDLPLHDVFARSTADVIIAKDWNGINMGIMFLRNAPFTFSLIDRMWNAPKLWWVPWEEQSALMALMKPSMNREDADAVVAHMEFPAQRAINAYGAEFAYGNRAAMYRPGDRIVHFPNCKAFASCRGTITRMYADAVKGQKVDDGVVPMTLFPKERPAA